jgi:hypothetical protein
LVALIHLPPSSLFPALLPLTAFHPPYYFFTICIPVRTAISVLETSSNLTTQSPKMQLVFLLAFTMTFLSAFAAPLYPRLTAVSDVSCTSKTFVPVAFEPSMYSLLTFVPHYRALDVHTKNVALLQICGGIAGTIQKCQGNPTTTTGRSGNVQFVRDLSH